MQMIPLRAVNSQVLTVTLAQQRARLKVYQKTTGLFMDVYVNDALIIGGVISEDRNRIVRDKYLGFIGDLAFYDTQGTSDPVASGLGARYRLLYLEAGE